MKKVKRNFINIISIIFFGLIPALLCQFFEKEPVDRYIHIRNFRYGKDPSVIRCNRGDRLHITFSTDDTGHSFFLEEFDIDAKVSPANNEVTIFKSSDPSIKPELTKQLTFTAKYSGILNYLVSKSAYRCHVWCGPMHAFEQGKLIIMPNTLLFLSIGCLAGILFLWLVSIFRKIEHDDNVAEERSDMKDLFRKNGFLRRIVISRWPLFLVQKYLVEILVY
jgi:hypothetical protein